MKKLILLISIVAILVLATPAIAGKKEPVGERLGLNVEVFPENTPFHMRHGWIHGSQPSKGSIGRLTYQLELDGEILKPDYQITYDRDLGLFVSLYVFNFPDGMTGIHEFIHHWYGPCYEFFETCEFPYKSVEVLTRYQTITFTP